MFVVSLVVMSDFRIIPQTVFTEYITISINESLIRSKIYYLQPILLIDKVSCFRIKKNIAHFYLTLFRHDNTSLADWIKISIP